LKIDFTETDLSPGGREIFKSLPTPAKRFIALKKIITPQEIARLAVMQYKGFLKTLYWRIIREYIIAEYKSCQYCGSKNQLNVHHLDYSQRGQEYKDLSCLILLCRACHETEHVIEKMADKNKQTASKLVAGLVQNCRAPDRPKTVINKDYDPRVIMNLKEYGDIRGRGCGCI